jgi:hypothetical protein
MALGQQERTTNTNILQMSGPLFKLGNGMDMAQQQIQPIARQSLAGMPDPQQTTTPDPPHETRESFSIHRLTVPVCKLFAQKPQALPFPLSRSNKAIPTSLKRYFLLHTIFITFF